MLYRCPIVFAAHPDDEIFMAGTMAKMAAEGSRVVVVQMTDGGEGYPEVAMKDTIVAMRAREAEAANRVLGVAQRYMLGRPDMGLVNDKATLQEVMAIIRRERPDAAFAQGGRTLHRDHLNTYHISVEALWHAGGPVCAALGPSWKTPEVYFYKDAETALKPFGVNVKGFGHKFFEALATQESQFTLFSQYFGVRSREELLREVERLKREGGRDAEHFWIARDVLGFDVLPESPAHRLPQWSPS